MKKNILFNIFLLALTIILVSWGGTGHYKISYNVSFSFGQQMSQFNAWTLGLAEHASDADDRKYTDPNESPKHYIDIDNYNEFIAIGRIPQTLDSVITIHGSSFVYNNGILPYATKTTFDTLKACFLRNDWTKALLAASDLGHYVGDGHMPLHITKNYDGDFTGNSGIHSRFESSMINTYESQINYTGDSVIVVPDVTQYIFNYLYSNYKYLDSVLAADDYAKTISSNTSSSQYKQALWEKSKNFTILLFKNASHALAELIYTAWVQAGSPTMPNSIFSNNFSTTNCQIQNFPNPFTNSTKIELQISSNTEVILQIKDISGKIISDLENSFKTNGTYNYQWNPKNIPSGIYYLILQTHKSIETKKLIYYK